MILKIKVTPSARATEITGFMVDNTIKIRIAAAPEKGKANKALIDFLSSLLALPKDKIEIVSGETSHIKLLKIPDGTPLPSILQNSQQSLL